MSGVYPNSGVPANEALNSVNVPTVNCPSELFHSTTRCQPRFDPAAANAVMSEILNAVNCGGVAYDCTRLDNLCQAMTNNIENALEGCLTVTFEAEPLLENLEAILGLNTVGLCTSIARVNNVRVQLRRLFNEFFLECITGPVPDAGQTCGTITQLVLINDGICNRIASYSAAATPSAQSSFRDVASHLPPDTQGYALPTNFPTPLNYYNLANLLADDNLGTGVLDEARILNSRLTRMSFVNDCSRRYNLTSRFFLETEATANAAYATNTRLFTRYRIGAGPWIYARSGGGQLSGIATFNAINLVQIIDAILLLPAGAITLEIFFVGNQLGDPNPRAGILANTFPTTGGFLPGQPGWFLRPSL